MPEKEHPPRPYLTMAVFCEKVLQERDGVLSLIRLISQMNIGGPAEEMPPTPIQVTAVVAFTAGFIRGKYHVKIKPTSPSGKEMSGAEIAAFFEGEDRGLNLIFNIGLVVQEEGVFWFDVLFENEVVTRIPLRVLYQRLRPGFPVQS